MDETKRRRQFPSTINTTSFVRLYILHLLIEKKRYGNEIKDEISTRLDNRWTPSPGMIYPLLNEMESEGYIASYWVEPTKRTKRYYNITDKGRAYYERYKAQNKKSLQDSYRIIKSIMQDIYKTNI